jgi:hypothetical protein
MLRKYRVAFGHFAISIFGKYGLTINFSLFEKITEEQDNDDKVFRAPYPGAFNTPNSIQHGM